jgi:hypothetical protein
LIIFKKNYRVLTLHSFAIGSLVFFLLRRHYIDVKELEKYDKIYTNAACEGAS